MNNEFTTETMEIVSLAGKPRVGGCAIGFSTPSLREIE